MTPSSEVKRKRKRTAEQKAHRAAKSAQQFLVQRQKQLQQGRAIRAIVSNEGISQAQAGQRLGLTPLQTSRRVRLLVGVERGLCLDLRIDQAVTLYREGHSIEHAAAENLIPVPKLIQRLKELAGTARR
jgi:hypothetical protein